MKLLLPRFLMVRYSWGWWVLEGNIKQLNNFDFKSMKCLCAGSFTYCLKQMKRILLIPTLLTLAGVLAWVVVR